MRWKKDKRINTGFISIKDFVGILLVLMVVNGCYVMIYLTYVQRGNGTINYIAPPMLGYLCTMTLIIAIISGSIRHNYFSRPMRQLGEAAKQIAQGDFSVRVKPLRKDGRKDYVEVMFEDFNKMVEELSSIETLKNDFIANVSHEIKTPLSIIQSYAMALQRSNLSEQERSEYTSTIIAASQKLSELVTNILKLNKLENQEIIPLSGPYDLSEQLRCCALAFEDLWERKDITFTADLDEEVIVTYDESMMEIIWNNLLSNALKFTEEGGSIALTLKTDDKAAIVSISDNGCGMDEETVKHIFDKFFQGDTSHSQQGNGLGLTLVMKVIEIFKGEIKVNSNPGYGTTFTVRLNL